MLRLVLKRMLSSRWMVICLLIGSIIATALVSCIPIYTDGILQRMLTKDLENYQLESGFYPGKYSVNSFVSYVYKGKARYDAYAFFEKQTAQMVQQLGLSAKAVRKETYTGNVAIFPPNTIGTTYNPTFGEFGSISGFEEHATIVHGKMFDPTPINNVYEAVVSESALKDLGLLLNQEYTLKVKIGNEELLVNVKIVGSYTYNDANHLFWDKDISAYSRRILLPDAAFKTILKDNPAILDVASWYYALDYYQIDLKNIDDISKTISEQHKFADKYKSGFELDFPALDIIKTYGDRAQQLNMMLWVLTVPVLLMIMFYIFMVSKLIVNHDENSIAVMKSRGASVLQIFNSYVIESGIISTIALLLGPPLGLFLCSILGSSNGFLEFVQRSALRVELNLNAYIYSFSIIFVLIITMLIPVIISSRASIVQHKQSKARNNKAPFWRKFFIDIILIGLSLYGLYRYRQQLDIINTTGISGLQLEIDPLLFLISTLFVLGTGLLFLRIYPLLIRFIYWIGKKFWSPVFYVSLIQVGRSRGQEQFLMLFIILAISTGIFNANSARTINRNNEDKINYSVGADISLMGLWSDNKPKGSMNGQTAIMTEPVRYYEPNYNDYANLEGIEQATKVITNDNGTLYYGSKMERSVKIMGVQPNEFARVAWFRNGLLRHHIIEYLNLMTENPTAFLVSTNLKERYGLKEGDSIQITWGDQGNLEGTVYAFIDYWPTYNPNKKIETGAISRPDRRNPNQELEATTLTQGLVVANMTYIQNKFAVQPYEIWIKKLPDTPDKTIYDDMNAKNVKVTYINYANQQLIKMKNDPMIQGTNGALTLGFSAAMMITLIGFLIYWIISIQSRALHFGILRAMGLSLAKVIGILACEQVLLSGTAILMGLTIGGITGEIFIPLLQMVYSSMDQVPPFKITAELGDYVKIYAVIGFMLFIGFITLWRLMAKLKIVQAVKLGED